MKKERINIRLSDTDKDNLERWLSQINAMNPSTPYNSSSLIRFFLEQNTWTIKPYLKKDEVIIAQTVSDISKIANNLNQIARNLNYFAKLSIVEKKDYTSLHKDLSELKKWIINANDIIRRRNTNDNEDQPGS